MNLCEMQHMMYMVGGRFVPESQFFTNVAVDAKIICTIAVKIISLKCYIYFSLDWSMIKINIGR